MRKDALSLARWRVVMTPEEFQEFALPHTAQITRATPTLFKYIPGRESHLGSGVLLRVGDKRFLLTAAHVADELRDMHWKGILFGTPRSAPIWIGSVRFLCSKKGTDPFRGDDPLDVAVVELSDEVADSLSEFMRFLSPDDLLLDPAKLADGIYLVNGFPDLRVDRDDVDETISAQNLPYFTFLFGTEHPPIPDFDPFNNIALDASWPHQDGDHSEGIDMDFTEGMSGGGIWRLYDQDQPFRSLDWEKAKLVGILTEGTDPAYTGSIGYFRGTKMRSIIRLLLAGWPELAPILIRSVPPHFVNDPT